MHPTSEPPGFWFETPKMWMPAPEDMPSIMQDAPHHNPEVFPETLPSSSQSCEDAHRRSAFGFQFQETEYANSRLSGGLGLGRDAFPVLEDEPFSNLPQSEYTRSTQETHPIEDVPFPGHLLSERSSTRRENLPASSSSPSSSPSDGEANRPPAFKATHPLPVGLAFPLDHLPPTRTSEAHGKGHLPIEPTSASGVRRNKGLSPYQFAKRTKGCQLWTTFVFQLSLDDVVSYGLVPKLIGHDGEIMKSISASCNAKLRIRGRGSRYCEVSSPDGKHEADIPLQIFLGAPDEESMRRARELTIDLLRRHDMLYARYCERASRPTTEFYMEYPGHLGKSTDVGNSTNRIGPNFEDLSV